MSIIDYTQIDDNTPIKGNVFNQRYGDIIGVMNGGIDASNIKPGSLTRELFAPNSMEAAWPIGAVFISVNNTNPGPQLGGNWVEFAKGRMIVGVDDTQTEFNTVEKQGGNKAMQKHSHTGSTSIEGNHSHSPTRDVVVTSGSGNARAGSAGGQQVAWNGAFGLNAAGAHSHSFTTNEAGSGDSGNLPPYITTYMWKRIS